MVVRELIALFGFEVDKKSAKTVDVKTAELFEKVKSTVVLAGTAVVGSFLVGVAESVGRLGDEIGKSSERLDMAAGALQELRYAAGRTEVDVAELEAGLRVVGRNAYEAANGNKEAAKSFAKLGVRVKDSNGKLKPSEQLLTEAADGIAKLTNHTERAALSTKVFGRSAGPALVPLLKLGSKGIADLRARARDLGGVLDDDLIRLAGEWDDSMKDVHDGVQGLKNAIGRALLPTMTKLNNAWVKLLMKHGDFIRQRLFRVVEGLGKAFGAFVELLANAADAIAEWAKNLDPLAGKFLSLGVAAAALAIILTLPAGSILLLIALVGLLIDDFYAWRDGGKSVLGDLLRSFEEFGSAFPAMSKAISFLGENIKVVFESIIQLVGSVVQLLFTVWDDPRAALRDFGQQVETLFGGLTDRIIERWKAVVDFIVGAVRSVMPKVGWVLDAARTVGGFVGGASEAVGGAVSSAASVVGRVAGGLVNEQSTQVEVNVNAQGATNPEAVGVAVARQVGMVIEDQNRAALSALTVAAARP